MSDRTNDPTPVQMTQDADNRPSAAPIHAPLPNYTLSTVCPACGGETYRHACKVRCDRCGFMWDCSEL